MAFKVQCKTWVGNHKNRIYLPEDYRSSKVVKTLQMVLLSIPYTWCVYTLAHAHAHAQHTHKHTRTHTRTHTHTCTHTHAHTYMYTHNYTNPYAYTFTSICIHIHTQVHTYTCTHMCTYKHTLTKKHTHVYSRIHADAHNKWKHEHSYDCMQHTILNPLSKSTLREHNITTRK